MGSPSEYYVETFKIENRHVWWITDIDEGCFCYVMGKDGRTTKAVIFGGASQPGVAPHYSMRIDHENEAIVFAGPYPLSTGAGVTIKVQCEAGSYVSVRDMK